MKALGCGRSGVAASAVGGGGRSRLRETVKRVLGCGRRCCRNSDAHARDGARKSGQGCGAAAERLRLDAISLGQCGAAAARRDATWFLNADCTWSRLRHVVSRDVGVAEEEGAEIWND